MNKGTEYLIGGILCLIISIAFMIMNKKNQRYTYNKKKKIA